MNQSIFNRTEMALKYLVQNSLEAQEQPSVQEYRRYDNSPSFLDSWCTVRLAGPRRSGHTTTILRVGRDMFESPLFLFHEKKYADQIRVEHNLKQYQCQHFRPIQEEYMRGRKYDAVFVDCAFLLSNEQEDKLRRVFGAASAEYDKRCMIYVG
jgi:hypothetical protein